MRKQVLIVEDHQHLAMALEVMLNRDPRFHVYGLAHDIPDAVAMMPASSADLVIVDINLPSGTGLELIPILRLIGPSARYLVFSQQDPIIYAPLSRTAGADGFLRKGAPQETILEAAGIIAAGGTYFPRLPSDR